MHLTAQQRCSFGKSAIRHLPVTLYDRLKFPADGTLLKETLIIGLNSKLDISWEDIRMFPPSTSVVVHKSI